MKPYRYADLVDVASLQKIAEANYRASGMPVGIVDATDGSIIVGAGWQDICTCFHRANPAAEQRCRESDTYITKHLQKDTPCAYKCANGLWDIGIPIIVDGQHLATLFLGQFFYEGEAPDRAFFIHQADAFGFDQQEYLAALDRVPVFSREKVGNIIEYDLGLAAFLADSADKVLHVYRAEAAQKKSEDRFRAIFQSVNDAIFLHEMPSGRVVDVNQRVTEMYGFARDEVLNMEISLLSSGISPYTLAHAKELLEKAAAEGSQVFEWQARHKDGHVFWVEVSLRKALIGAQEYLLATVRDTTGRRQLEEQLRQSQKMEAVGVLAGGVAHDFNNILQAIMSSANLIRLKYSSNEGLQHMVDDILILSERAADLTRGLLAFSRKQIIDPRTQDLNELIRTATNLYARVLGEDIELRLDLSPGRLGVHVDTSHVQQVLLNLMTNARDAMPTGGMLTISTARDIRTVPDLPGMPAEKLCAVMVVRDTGHGIDPKDLPHIFEPFYTTKDVGKGTGLGLSVVYGILQQHGGSIAVTSPSGGGTTFTILLPIVEERKQVMQAPVEQAGQGGGETILLVEDDALVRKATASILIAYGYAVLTAANGAEAIQMHREHRAAIRMVLLDVIMPGMNGERVYEALAAEQPGLKVIFLSGYPKEVLEQKKLAEVMYLPKPVAPADLIKAIKTILSEA